MRARMSKRHSPARTSVGRELASSAVRAVRGSAYFDYTPQTAYATMCGRCPFEPLFAI